MGFRRVTTEQEIAEIFSERTRRLKMATIRQMQIIGEKAVNHARSLPSPSPINVTGPHQPNYIDWTANLRSSIGYVLVVDGTVIEDGGYEGESEGAKAGKKLAREAAKKFPIGIALIVTAGMHYASYVEAKGYDVLASAETVAETLVKELKGKIEQIKL